MTRTKVLVAANQSHITEIEMIKAIHGPEFEMHVVLSPTSPHFSTLEKAGIPTYPVRLKNNIDIPQIRALRQWLRQENFAVVHGLANRPIANLIWASYRLKHKLIAYRGAVGHVSRWDPTCYLKWLNPRIDQVICVSKAVENDLAENGVNREKLRTIYKGHKASWYENYDQVTARQFLNEEFNIPDNAILVGMAANMRRVKGADILIKAMELLPDNVYALLIGEVRDPQLKTLASKQHSHDRIIFTGFRENAKELIGGLDINTAPSRGREGLTKAVLEAMAQGRPSVVSNAGGLSEIVEDGTSGYVTEMEDISAFAARISHLTKNPAARFQMGQNAKIAFETRFSIDKTIVETIALYRELIRWNND